MICLPENFYQQEVTLVARQLLGMRLVRKLGDKRVAGIIVEAEAYRGEEDLACHAHVGKTRRNEVMYGKAGRAYVYFTYGMHWMLNAVAGSEGFPAAVLIRAIQPTEALDEIKTRRPGRSEIEWCNGPAKICKSLDIDGSLNGTTLYDPNNALWIEEGFPVQNEQVKISPRIGLGNTPEPWKSKLWRFWVDIKELKIQ